MSEGHDPYAVLRHRDYRRLLTANVLASFGTQMQNVAVFWEIHERTGSALALGLVGLVQFYPVIQLSLYAGHAADRYSRKGLLIGAQALMILASSSLAVLSFWQGPVPLIYAALLFVGVSRAFNTPARWSLLAQVVPEADMANAITWNSSGWQVASMTGPAVGGLVISVAGPLGAYLSTIGCLLTVVVLLFSIRPRPIQRSREPLSLQSLLAGIQFVRHNRLILATITLDLFAVLLGGATALLPIYAKDILHVGPTGYGWLQAAPSIGAFSMALFLAHRPPLQRAGRALLWAVAGFGLATIVFGLSDNVVLSFAMLIVTGALDNISIVVRGTLIQVLTPDGMRGRVTAVNAIFIGSSNELGAFESGLTAKLFGPVVSVVGGGIGTLVVVVAAMLIWPEILRLGTLRSTPELVKETT
jgi:MFS family permease